MKKTLLVLAAICMTMAANAKILRVSNVSGSSAPYTSIEDAHNAASTGDTIMIDASPDYYGGIYADYQITKKLVILGPGYWLIRNGIMEEGANWARVNKLTIKTSGVVVKGLYLDGIEILAPQVVVNRCILGYLAFGDEADNGAVTQCFITSAVNGANHILLTNNIFTSTTIYHVFSDFKNSIIAYNTFRNKNVQFNNNVHNCTIENNLWKACTDNGSGNSFNNNYQTDIINTQATDKFNDTDYYNLEIPTEVTSLYGAFAGDSPYVISGIPTGPYIIGIDAPSTVEVGSTPTVTIKVNISK